MKHLCKGNIVIQMSEIATTCDWHSLVTCAQVPQLFAYNLSVSI